MSSGRYPTRSKPTRPTSMGDAAWNPEAQEIIVIEDSPTPTASSSTTSGAFSHQTSRPSTVSMSQQNSMQGPMPPLTEGFTNGLAHYTRGAAAQASKRIRSEAGQVPAFFDERLYQRAGFPQSMGTYAKPTYDMPAMPLGMEHYAHPLDQMRTVSNMSQQSSRPVTAATWRPLISEATPSSPATGTPFSYSQQALTASSAGKRKRDETQLLQPAQRTYPQQAAPAVTRRPATPPPVQEKPTRFVDMNKGRPVALRKEYSAQYEALGATSFDDSEGHYVIVPNAPLTKRYKIIRLLGQGTFGKVVQAYDHLNRIFVAIKIIRAVQKYRDASMIELRVLRTLYQRDPNNWNNCIHLRDCFDYRNHVCIVTDLLGESIFDFLKGNDFAPFPRQHIQDFARQLFKSVAFLHFANLIHTDLKPENILLVSNEYHLQPWRGRTANVVTRKVLENSDIRLIDFGSATFEDEYHSTVVSTRHYRAPEIILGMGWSYPCDIWSIGCILLELFTGDALFQTHDNLEHLAMMDVVCGPMDGRIVRQSSKLAQKMFRTNGRLDYPNKETTKDSRKFVKQMKPLAEMLPRRSSIFCEQFGKLLQEIFVYDPTKRITAKKALAHPFFQIDPNT